MWYRDGLRFACTQCGHCCTTEGYVWMSPEEVHRTAEHLGLSDEEFSKRYLRLVQGRRALIDRSDGACIFWDEGCKVYAARPTQCQTFPFWRETVATEGDWSAAAGSCEGIGEGRLYSISEISSLVEGRSETAPALERPEPEDESDPV